MGKDFYLSLNNKFKQYKRILNILDKICTYSVFISYPILLIFMFIKNNSDTLKLIIITLIPFILVSIFRKVISKDRPYEVFGISPILDKDTKGKSFPSRHVFSAFLIGTAIFGIYPIYGITVLILGLMIALIRVIGGVHFLCDVFAGMLLGIIFGILGVMF